MEAASELFTQRGYSGTTTKDLAARAGVAESVVFHNFGSKDELFREVMLNPFVAFMEEFGRRSKRFLDQGLPVETTTRLLVSELYDLLRDHRVALRSLLAAEGDMQREALDALHQSVDRLLDDLGAVFEQEGQQRGLVPTTSSWDLTFRTAFGTLFSAAVLDYWLLPPGEVPREQMVENLTQFLTNGFFRSSEPD